MPQASWRWRSSAPASVASAVNTSTATRSRPRSLSRPASHNPARGRTAVSHTGAARSTVNHWHQHRDRFGFPNAFVDDGQEWFWRDDVEVFHAAHLTNKKAVLTKVDRSGSPNELITSSGAAEILGYSSYRTS